MTTNNENKMIEIEVTNIEKNKRVLFKINENIFQKMEYTDIFLKHLINDCLYEFDKENVIKYHDKIFSLLREIDKMMNYIMSTPYISRFKVQEMLITIENIVKQ